MAARALWKAVLKIGRTPIPVRLYSAVQDRDTHFHMLHGKDQERVHERMRRADNNEIVEHADARSGYVLDSGETVLLAKDEIKKLAPEPSRDIALVHCAHRDDIPMAAFARPYWLGPDGDSAAYFALAEALTKLDRVAVSEWVLRGKHHYGALSARDGYLMLVELRSADQWLDSKGLQTPDGPAESSREVAMAEQLIEGLDGTFDHASFHDSYREEVQKLVEAKAKGRKLPKQRAPRKAPERSLGDALTASLAALKKAKPQAREHKERKSA
ncbi:MAG: Ku protein [Polyangiales bacterium]